MIRLYGHSPVAVFTFNNYNLNRLSKILQTQQHSGKYLKAVHCNCISGTHEIRGIHCRNCPV